MSRGTWDVQIKTGGSWTSDSTIYRPNDSLGLGRLSTQSKTTLADGHEAFVTPETKYQEEDLTFIWYYDDGTVKSKIEGYITGGTDVKIIDHDNNEYVGRFSRIDSTWLVGLDSDKYDIRAIFTRMPSIA